MHLTQGHRAERPSQDLNPCPSLCQALLGDQYGPSPVPTLIEEKEWEALRAQLTSRPRDLDLVARRFRRDENAVPPTYLLQALGTVEAHGPEEATLTSVLRSGAQEARRLGLITQEQWYRYHWSGEAVGTPARGHRKCPEFKYTHRVLSKCHSLHSCKYQTSLAPGSLVLQEVIVLIPEFSQVLVDSLSLRTLLSSPPPAPTPLLPGRLLVLREGF